MEIEQQNGNPIEEEERREFTGSVDFSMLDSDEGDFFEESENEKENLSALSGEDFDDLVSDLITGKEKKFREEFNSKEEMEGYCKKVAKKEFFLDERITTHEICKVLVTSSVYWAPRRNEIARALLIDPKDEQKVKKWKLRDKKLKMIPLPTEFMLDMMTTFLAAFVFEKFKKPAYFHKHTLSKRHALLLYSYLDPEGFKKRFTQPNFVVLKKTQPNQTFEIKKRKLSNATENQKEYFNKLIKSTCSAIATYNTAWEKREDYRQTKRYALERAEIEIRNLALITDDKADAEVENVQNQLREYLVDSFEVPPLQYVIETAFHQSISSKICFVHPWTESYSSPNEKNIAKKALLQYTSQNSKRGRTVDKIDAKNPDPEILNVVLGKKKIGKIPLQFEAKRRAKAKDLNLRFFLSLQNEGYYFNQFSEIYSPAGEFLAGEDAMLDDLKNFIYLSNHISSCNKEYSAAVRRKTRAAKAREMTAITRILANSELGRKKKAELLGKNSELRYQLDLVNKAKGTSEATFPNKLKKFLMEETRKLIINKAIFAVEKIIPSRDDFKRVMVDAITQNQGHVFNYLKSGEHRLFLANLRAGVIVVKKQLEFLEDDNFFTYIKGQLRKAASNLIQININVSLAGDTPPIENTIDFTAANSWKFIKSCKKWKEFYAKLDANTASSGQNYFLAYADAMQNPSEGSFVGDTTSAETVDFNKIFAALGRVRANNPAKFLKDKISKLLKAKGRTFFTEMRIDRNAIRIACSNLKGQKFPKKRKDALIKKMKEADIMGIKTLSFVFYYIHCLEMLEATSDYEEFFGWLFLAIDLLDADEEESVNITNTLKIKAKRFVEGALNFASQILKEAEEAVKLDTEDLEHFLGQVGENLENFFGIFAAHLQLLIFEFIRAKTEDSQIHDRLLTSCNETLILGWFGKDCFENFSQFGCTESRHRKMMKRISEAIEVVEANYVNFHIAEEVGVSLF